MVAIRRKPPKGRASGFRTERVSTMGESLTITPNGTGQADGPVRDSDGRFLPGNKAGVGHGGSAKDLARWRRVALEATTDQDMLDIWGSLITSAKQGEPWAVHEFLDRTMGKVQVAPPEAAQDTSALMAALWEKWAAPRPEGTAGGQAEPVEDVAFEVKEPELQSQEPADGR